MRTDSRELGLLSRKPDREKRASDQKQKKNARQKERDVAPEDRTLTFTSNHAPTEK